MSTPSVRGFQLDASAVGDAAKSVNLFRGDVNMPLNLVHLGGPQDLDLILAGFYASNVGQQVNTWNLEAPTSILGLGWSLPFDYIGVSGGGTASWREGSYTLYSGGNAHPLTLLGYDAEVTQLSFADSLNPLWSITYELNTELWTIVRDDGVTLTFGDPDSGRDTVQWGVRWGNWAGNSSAETGSPAPYAVAWNLSTMTNVWGHTIQYSYAPDTQPVTTTFGYTRACYLAKIVDAYDRSVILSYAEKDALEYQAPHTLSGATPTSGYQDRYETRYLTRIDVCPPHSDGSLVYYSLLFGYALKNLGSDANGSNELTNICKRYLTTVVQQRNGLDVTPPMRFAYDLAAASTSAGRLSSVTYPTGGQVRWQYADIDLGAAAPSSIFNLTYSAVRPDGYANALPQLWFGTDYVVVGWYTGATLGLQIYSYGGRWSDAWPSAKPYEIDGVNPQADGTSNADKLAQIRLATGEDFFALHFHNQGSSSDHLYCFQKTPYQFGNWSPTRQTVTLHVSAVVPDETTLVAGRNTLALHVGGDTQLHRFAYDRVNQAWSDDSPISHNSASRIALAAQHNALFACFFTDDGNDVRGESIIYCLNPDQTWGSSGTQLTGSPTSIAWRSDYAQSYWQLGPGFAVGTGLDGTNAKLQIVHWAPNYASFSLLNRTLSNGAAFSTVGESVVFNGGTCLRYDGQSWQSIDIGFKDSDGIVAGEDMVLRARKSGSYYSENVLATFDASANTWHSHSFPPAGSNPEGYSYPSPPQLSGNFLTLGNQVYYRGSDNEWQPVASDNPLPHVYGSTVSNRGPNFIAYQDADNRSSAVTPDTRVALLKNGDVLSVSDPYTSQKVQDEDGIAVLCGGNAFATYDAQVSSFSHVGEFTLHRVLNCALADPSACVVKTLTIDTGQQQLVTTYDYDATQAVFDASGAVVQFPKVTATHRSADDGTTPRGESVYQYFNGLDPANEPALESAVGITDCYSLANGYLHTVTEYDDSEQLVATMTNLWTGLTYDDTFVTPTGVTTLKSESVTHSFENLPTICLEGSGEKETTSALVRSQTFSYDSATGYVAKNSFVQYNAQGLQETRTVSYTRGWTQYAGMKTARLLRPVVKTVLSVSSGSNSHTVQAFAKTWSNHWSESSAWARQGGWVWKGSGTTDFDFDDPDNNSGWLAQSSVVDRNAQGFKVLTEDALGTPSLTLYDALGFWPVARLGNARHGNVMGFESYEDLAPWALAGGAQVLGGDAHTGARCAHLPAGASLSNPALTAGSGLWVFSCWVKSIGNSKAQWVIAADSGNTTLQVPSTPEWQYLYTTLAINADDCAIRVSLDNDAGTLLVDDVRFTPVACRLSITVYDDGTWYPCAKLGPNGETVRVLYDERLRTLASIGANENVASIHARYYTESGLKMFDSGDLNSNLLIRPRGTGAWDDFRDTDWQQHWSGDQNCWQVQSGALVHQGQAKDSVSMKATANCSDYGVRLRVTVPGTALPGADIGLQVGQALKVQWSADKQRWELWNQSSLVSQAAGSAQGDMDWLLIAGNQGLVFFLNDQQILQASGEQPLTGTLSLFTGDDGVAFAQVLVFEQPLIHMLYTDGNNRPIQVQQLADNHVVAHHLVYDDLGRPAIRTKPVGYPSSTLGYRNSLVTGIDSETGAMTGDVADYYDGTDGRSDDGGYPYARRRIEYSALSRLLEVGHPGRAFAIGAENAHTVSYRYGVNGASPFFDASGEQQYKVRLRVDEDGLTGAAISDLIGNRLARVSGPAGLASDCIYSAFELDWQDNRIGVSAPNCFDPPSGEPADWRVARTFDYRNKLVESNRSDTGQTQAIYDDLGRLRFKLIADGRGSGSQNPCGSCSESPVTILYRRYDALSRLTEQGAYCVASWNEAAQHANKDWPTNAANWQFRYRYDGDGSQPYTIGRLLEVHSNSAELGEVIERLSYNIYGQATSYTLQQGTESTCFGYTHDTQGRVTTIDYPAVGSLPAHTVSYGHDGRGLLTDIGTPQQANAYAHYTLDATRRVTGATLGTGGGAITRTYHYHPRGWLQRISDDCSTETLRYDGPNAADDNTPRYNGRVSAIDYQRSDGTELHWRYGYDPVGRLANVTEGKSLQRSYAYDPNGNLLRITTNDQPLVLSYQGSNFLTKADGQSYTALPSGAVGDSPSWSLGYEFASRLPASVNDTQSGQLTRFGYGVSAQRLSKTVTGLDGHSLSSGRYYPGLHKRPLLERRGNGSSDQTLRYVYGRGGILALQTEAATYFVLQDHQRSNRVLASGAGAEPVGVFDYLPYGETYGTVGGTNPALLAYRYTGQEWDAESGLYNFRHRLYDPTIGRFLAPDPKGQYFSPYAYAGGHPILLNDPSGEFSLFGTVLSGAEIVVGAALTFSPAAPLGLMMVGAGAAGLNYSLRAKHFNSSQYFQVEAAAAVSTAEIEAGVALTVVSAGAAYQVGGGTLTGAGMGGLANTFTQINTDPNGDFNWGSWGIAEGVGAVVGTAFGAVGAVAGAGAGAGASAVADAAEVAGPETAEAAASAANASAGSGGAAGLVEDTAGAVADAGDGGAAGGGGGADSGGANGMVMDTAQGPVDPGNVPAVQADPGGGDAGGGMVMDTAQGGPGAPEPPAPAPEAPAPAAGEGGNVFGVEDTSGVGEAAQAADVPQAVPQGGGASAEVDGGAGDVEGHVLVSGQWGRIMQTDYI